MAHVMIVNQKTKMMNSIESKFLEQTRNLLLLGGELNMYSINNNFVIRLNISGNVNEQHMPLDHHFNIDRITGCIDFQIKKLLSNTTESQEIYYELPKTNSLNLQYNELSLLLIALNHTNNECGRLNDASRLLGITTRTVRNLIENYKIIFNVETNKYFVTRKDIQHLLDIINKTNKQ